MVKSRLQNVKLSAIIACYRDAPVVGIMHERLVKVFKGIGVDYEIIFVNDGSPDNARDALSVLASTDPKVTVINHTRAFGSQSAFTSGMKIASGDAVILMDGDLQDPPEVIPEFVERWRKGYDVVYGERVKREAPLFMRVAYKAFYRLFRQYAYVKVPLDAGDFSLIDRRVVDSLNQLPENHRFIRGLRAWVGYKQIGVPYTRPERLVGKSTNSVVGNFGWAWRAIVSFSYAPLSFITIVALATTSLAFISVLVQIILRIVDPQSAPQGFTLLFGVVLFMGGVQLLCISILGSYIAHIYEEVKHRPAYIVDDIVNPPTTKSLFDKQPKD